MAKSERKTSITINYRDIILILRIITLLLAVGILSFVLIYYGVFSPESYFGCVLLLTAVIYITLPIIFCFCPYLHQSLVFQAHVDADEIDFERPQDLKGVRNFRISAGSDSSIGLWHMLPSSLSESCENQDESFWKNSVRTTGHNGVIIYFHGVTGNRGKWHRKELYQVLQNQEHHVISCDYRGFADSTKVHRITENGVVTDALNVYKWVRQELLGGILNIPVFVWGHSLGAGISSHAVAKLQSLVDVPHPSGLVLESPFNNFAEELRHHAKLKIWSLLPFFDRFFINPLRKSDITFQNDGHISKILVPIMIMHARDDNVIPSHLGKRLFEAGRLRRPSNPLYFVHMKNGKHNEMYKLNAEFGKILNLFTNACIAIASPTSCCWHHHCSDADAEILCSNC